MEEDSASKALFDSVRAWLSKQSSLVFDLLPMNFQFHLPDPDMPPWNSNNGLTYQVSFFFFLLRSFSLSESMFLDPVDNRACYWRSSGRDAHVGRA
jgi:hypothetical protein